MAAPFLANAQGITHIGNGSVHHNNINSGNKTTNNQGGKGGTGGTGIGVGVGKATSKSRSNSNANASATSRANSSSKSNVRSSNKNGQLQGQLQGHNINDESYTDNSYTDNTNYEDNYVGAPSLGGIAAGNCTAGGAELSAGWVGGAFGIGSSKQDPECKQRKAASLACTTASEMDAFLTELQSRKLVTACVDTILGLDSIAKPDTANNDVVVQRRSAAPPHMQALGIH